MNIRPGFSQGRDYCENYGGVVPQGRRKMSSFFLFCLNPELIWELACPPAQTQHLTLSYCTCCSGRPSAMLHPKYLRVNTVPGGSISIQYLLPTVALIISVQVSQFPDATPLLFPLHSLKASTNCFESYLYLVFFVEEADGKTPDGHWDDWKSNSPGLWMPGTVSATKATWVLRGISCWKECLHCMRKSYS